jgi:hypothetical protein
MDNKVINPKWQDRYEVLAPEDNDALEAKAAIHEFRGGLHKEEAESKAHEDYLKDHAVDSAAHHYIGMRAATASNHEPAAKKHGTAYTAAMKHLGYNPLDIPPKDVLDRVKDIDKNPYKFTPHKADGFFASKEEPKAEEPNKTQELLTKLKSLRAKPSP